MTFKLTKTPLKYWWPVEVSMPGSPTEAQAGNIETHTFNLLFQGVSVGEAMQLDAEMSAGSEKEQHANRDRIIEKVVKGWDNVIGDDGVAVPFSLEAFRELMSVSWVRLAVYRAYAQSLSGVSPSARPKASGMGRQI